MGELGVKDLELKTEVYLLKDSNPPGKVVVRKGSNVVIIWPGDLSKVIDQLIDLEWGDVDPSSVLGLTHDTQQE